MLKAEIKGGNLVVVIPINDLNNLPLSAKGKSLVVASSYGNVATTVQVNGQPLIVGLNSYIKNHNYVAPENGKAKTPIAGRYGPNQTA